MSEEHKKLLLNLISDVKARLDGKVDSVCFPIPQFVVVGKQSVGKSRLIEALAGETFNFVSGTLGSRRPTVLEFRNVPGLVPSRWSVLDQTSHRWDTFPVEEVMRIVGGKHEELGQTVSEVPVRVKVEGADCVDLGIVDLPGFRTYSKDAGMQDLAQKIEKLALKFMNDENNVMLCVEEAGDAAGFSTLGKCKQVDPSYRRTVLIRNKLDKFYSDLAPETVNKWLQGYGDLPSSLHKFALSLPHWVGNMPKAFVQLRQESSDADIQALSAKGASAKYTRTIGFKNFQSYIEFRTQQLFADALVPLLARLKSMRDENEEHLTVVKQESDSIDEGNILHATRSAGVSFSQSFNFLMEGALSSEENRRTLGEELRAFHRHCDTTGCLSDEERATGEGSFKNLDDYIDYLRDTVRLPGMDVQLNGGAQFRRLMYEVEVFTRFAGLGDKFRPEDVIQARGSGMRAANWQDTIVTLMLQNAPLRMIKKTRYVGERLRWFFSEQKEAVVQFMLTLKGSPEEHLYSRLISQQAMVIQRNETMKNCIFTAFDEATEAHKRKFMQMWNDYMDSMFQSPLVLLKSATIQAPDSHGEDEYEGEMAPTFESTKTRIESEIRGRSKLQGKLKQDIKDIPDDDHRADQAVNCVQQIIEEVFSCIRCLVADQMQLYSESFFLLPMLRRLEGAMSTMDLAEEDKERNRVRKLVLDEEYERTSALLKDLIWCADAVQKFKLTCGGGQ